ncbi:hypothetical protein D3C86_1793010 [compost metagenome]
MKGSSCISKNTFLSVCALCCPGFSMGLNFGVTLEGFGNGLSKTTSSKYVVQLSTLSIIVRGSISPIYTPRNLFGLGRGHSSRRFVSSGQIVVIALWISTTCSSLSSVCMSIHSLPSSSPSTLQTLRMKIRLRSRRLATVQLGRIAAGSSLQHTA